MEDVARIFGRPSALPPAPQTDAQGLESVIENLERMHESLDGQIEEIRVAFEAALGNKEQERERLAVAIAALRGEELPAAKPKRGRPRKAAPASEVSEPAARKLVEPRQGSVAWEIVSYLKTHGQTPGRILVNKMVEAGKASSNAGCASTLSRLVDAGNIERVLTDGDRQRPSYRLPGQDETSWKGA